MLGRSKHFIDRFKSVAGPKCDCKACSCTNLFFIYAYGLKVLLDDDTWNEEFQPIISHFRMENEVIWNFLIENKMVPDDYQRKFINYAKGFAIESIDDSYEDIFLTPVERLINNGATQLDLDLYRASVSLEFEETQRLLELGAVPDKDILIMDSDDDECPEIWSSLGNAFTLWNDAYESCMDFHLIWEEEYEVGVKQTLSDSVFSQIIISAAYKLMYELLEKYDKSA